MPTNRDQLEGPANLKMQKAFLDEKNIDPDDLNTEQRMEK